MMRRSRSIAGISLAAIICASAVTFAGMEQPCVGVAPFSSPVISPGKMAAFSNMLSARLEQAGFRVIGWDDIVRVVGEKNTLADLASGVVSKIVTDAAGAADISWIIGGSLTKNKNGRGLTMTCWIRDVSGAMRSDSLSVRCSGDDPAVFLLSMIPSVANRMSRAIKNKDAKGAEYLASMVFIPGGDFSIIDGGAGKNTSFFIAPFYIGKYPVTSRAYCQLLVIENDQSLRDTTPIRRISWYDAVLYCNALSKKHGLDTVYGFAEIRGEPGAGCFLTDCVTYPEANGFRLPTRLEWERTFCGSGVKGVMAPDTSEAEWTNDAADAEGRIERGESTNPQGPETATMYRIVKGLAYVRSCHENAPFNPQTTRNVLGFRISLPVR
jgi:hypothetical protein